MCGWNTGLSGAGRFGENLFHAKTVKDAKEKQRQRGSHGYYPFVTENNIAAQVVDAALRLHRGLAPGLMESVYGTVLAHELRKLGLL